VNVTAGEQIQAFEGELNMSAGITEAPVIYVDDSGFRYPTDGKVMGPLWQDIWDLLSDGKWHLATHVSAHPSVKDQAKVSTIYKILSEAARYGVLKKSEKNTFGTLRVMYRRVA